jgi:type II secretory pathway component PulC
MSKIQGVLAAGFCGVAIFLSGCSMSSAPSATKISEYRGGEPTNRETIERAVMRRDFQAAVERSQGADRLRLVPVFRRETAGGGIPEYRLFDVGANTPYALLGLQTADILVAANDYLIYEPEGFRRYVRLLGGESAVTLEVVRSGKPTLLRTTFTE